MRPLIAIASMIVAFAQPAPAREVAFQADNYTVYLEEPQYCSMFLDSPTGAMMRFSYRRTNGAVFFSYVRPDLRPIDPNQGVMIALEFDDVRTNRAFGGFPYDSGDGRYGFGFTASIEMLQNWARGRSVTIRNARDGSVFERVVLRGSAAAINSLTACTLPGYSVTVMPAPPPAETASEPGPALDTAAAVPFRAACVGGRSLFYVDRQMVRTGLECDGDWMPTMTHSRRFPSGEQVLLVQRGGGGIASAGSIIYIRPGATPRSVDIDYMTEFTEIRAPDRIAFAAAGVFDINQGETWWRCEVTIDWSRGRIVSSRELESRTGRC